MDEKLKELCLRCKASVSFEYNQHKDYHQSVDSFIRDYLSTNNITPEEEIGREIYGEMIKQDTIVYLHFYPNTPIGFYRVWHYDTNKALDIALEILNNL